MAINLTEIVKKCNEEHPDPEYEAVVDFVEQKILLRRKIKLPLLVASRENIEDGMDVVRAYGWALDYVRGHTSEEYDSAEAFSRMNRG